MPRISLCIFWSLMVHTISETQKEIEKFISFTCILYWKLQIEVIFMILDTEDKKWKLILFTSILYLKLQTVPHKIIEIIRQRKKILCTSILYWKLQGAPDKIIKPCGCPKTAVIVRSIEKQTVCLVCRCYVAGICALC